MSWRAEIVEMHAFFEEYFLGQTNSLARAEQALASDFTMVGADGVEHDREATLTNLLAGHAHTQSLKITTHGHRRLADHGELIVATYVESHELSDRDNHRLTTVVFRRAELAPQGLHWVRAHETWIDRDLP